MIHLHKLYANTKHEHLGTAAPLDTRSYHELNLTDRKCFVRERGKC